MCMFRQISLIFDWKSSVRGEENGGEIEHVPSSVGSCACKRELCRSTGGAGMTSQ